jgi:histidine triad (HIT) family protein
MCIFCEIVENKIPAYRVYENDISLAFLDIAPVNPGHTLVIPKKHYANLEEIPEEELKELMMAVKKVALMLKNNFGVLGYNLSVNNDPVAGQEIAHLHFHLIPRKEDDGLKLWPQGEYSEGQAEEVLKKILNK